MIPRPDPLRQIQETLRVHPVAALLGPRQCGKTTLARVAAAKEPSTFFDLENPVDRQRLAAPMTVLEGLTGLVVLDEIQRMPELFELLRVLVDRPGSTTRFLVLGSASPGLIKGSSETLAGRMGFVDLAGLQITEVGDEQLQRLWIRGGFPRSFCAPDERSSWQWRESFVRTFLERDLPQLGISIPAETLRRFWTMVAHYHGQLWNSAEIGRSLGFSANTARKYLELMAAAFVVRILPPWHENVGKRQVRSPKVYLRDSGLLHTLLRLASRDEVQGHPKLGASWEGFALESLLSHLATRDAYFWATHGGAELDLMVLAAGKRLGFEVKYSDAPSMTKSMRIALEDLDLEHLWVIYPGRESYQLEERVTALPLGKVPQLLPKESLG